MCTWSTWIFSSDQFPFCLSQSEVCLSLITLPTSTQMRWQLWIGGGTWDFQGHPYKCDLRRWDMKFIIWNTLFKKNSTELSIKAKLLTARKNS